MPQVSHFFIVESVADDVVTEIGVALAKARQLSGLGLAEFAAVLTAAAGFPVTPDYLIAAEQGRADLPASVLVHAARVSGVDLGLLLGDGERYHEVSGLERAIVELRHDLEILAQPE